MSGPPGWTEVRVAVPLGWHELVAEVLAVGPCTTVALGRTSIGMEPAPAGCDWVRTFVLDDADTAELREGIRTALAGLEQSTGAAELAAA